MDSAKSHDSGGAPLWLTFFIALPFACPLQHGSVLSRTLDEPLEGCEALEVRATDQSIPLGDADKNRMFVSLKFWQLKDTVDIADPLHGLLQVVHEVTGVGRTPEETVPIPENTYRTVVEMVTAQNADKLENMDSALDEAFTRCFDMLSDVYSMSRLVKRESLPPHVGMEQAQIAFWFGRFPGQDYSEESGGVYWISPPSYFPTETMNEAEFEQLKVLLGRVWNGSPLEVIMERSFVASQYLNQQGDYANAVIHAALSAEILLDSVLGLMLWEEQIEAPDFQAAVDIFDEAKNGGLTSRVRREYAPRLGGIWNPSQKGPVRHWKDELAFLRGRVVHRGYRPSRAEAERALEVGDELLDFVKARLASRAKQYPRTCLMILGEPGLRRIGGWRAAERFLGSTDEHPLRWFSGYSTWRDTVDALGT
ncbi:hypothetical protein ACF06L_16515 [Streptomyces sp. NPDC015408]|uniref:hypothetical protein n=1 Tax=Streptomyces sp. NPDC015408 TaxID=3364956 RepID=UPI0036F59A91